MNRCSNCNKDFLAKHKLAKYCSAECKTEKDNRIRREKTQEKFSHPVRCKGCGSNFFRQRSGKKIFCTESCKGRFHSKENKDRSRWSRLEVKYGVSRKEWESILEKQNGKCPICKKELVSPHTDHDHATGKIRGILCQKCNQGLGMFEDSKKNLRSAIRYLQ